MTIVLWQDEIGQQATKEEIRAAHPIPAFLTGHKMPEIPKSALKRSHPS